MIEYRFDLAPLTRRDRYAKNIARSFDWQSKPRLEPPELPRPVQVASAPCPGESGGATKSVPDHDLMKLHTSGFLERLGFDFVPASTSGAFRYPNSFERAYFGGT
jgi:phospholipase C